MSIRFRKLPHMDPVGPHRKWISISDVSGPPSGSDGWPVLGYAQVHYTKPIPNIVLGNKNLGWNHWIYQVQGFNDGDDKAVPDPIGTFGYVHTWPAVKPVYQPKKDRLLVVDEVHRSEYENAVAFKTFPICPFYTKDDVLRVQRFYETRSPR